MGAARTVQGLGGGDGHFVFAVAHEAEALGGARDEPTGLGRGRILGYLFLRVDHELERLDLSCRKGARAHKQKKENLTLSWWFTLFR